MAIRILVNGAHGKMGQEVTKALADTAEFAVVGQTGRNNDLGQAITASQAQIVVDFSSAHAVYENTLTIINNNVCPVIGTTGLLADQIEDLQKRCAQKKLGGIIAPNFSIGAVLMMQFAQTAARYFSHAEIIEQHHPGKVDSPSGTAIKTSEMMAKARTTSVELKKSLEIIPGARGALNHNIPIHAVRLPGLVASQEVLFGGLGETLSIRHNTIHREAFMPGVLLACRKVLQLNHLIYGLENIL